MMMKIENLAALNLNEVAAQEAEARKRIAFLGHLLWYTISECSITPDELDRCFTASGLHKRFFPRPISPRDAFRRATSNAERTRIPLGQNGGRKHLNLLIREVKADRDVLIRHLVREIVDAQNVRLEYLPVAAFHHEGGMFRVENLAPLNSIEIAAVQRVDSDYHHACHHYTDRTIRDVVQDALRTCSPVAVRPSGGVYFVPIAHEATVRSLQGFVHEVALTTATDARLWTVPVVDAVEQRQMLYESLQEQVKAEGQRLVAEMNAIIRGQGRKLTRKVAEDYMNRVRDLGNLTREYEAFLEMEAVAAKATVEMAAKEVMALLAKISDDE